MNLPTPASVAHMQFQVTSIGTALPIAESTRVPRTSEVQALNTLCVTGYVSSQDNVMEE